MDAVFLAMVLQMELTVRHVGPGSACDCTTPQGVTMAFDDPDTGNHGPSPVQHLLASIGACALVDIAVILKKKRLEFRDLKVVCTGTRREAPPPRVFQDVRLRFEVAGNVPQKVFDEVVALSADKYCSVAGTVRESATVSYEAVVR